MKYLSRNTFFSYLPDLNNNAIIFIAGKYVNHKGRNRHFTDIEELEQERKKAELKKWRKKQGDEEEEESSSEEEEASEKSGGSGSGL